MDHDLSNSWNREKYLKYSCDNIYIFTAKQSGLRGYSTRTSSCSQSGSHLTCLIELSLPLWSHVNIEFCSLGISRSTISHLLVAVTAREQVSKKEQALAHITPTQIVFVWKKNKQTNKKNRQSSRGSGISGNRGKQTTTVHSEKATWHECTHVPRWALPARGRGAFHSCTFHGQRGRACGWSGYASCRSVSGWTWVRLV